MKQKTSLQKVKKCGKIFLYNFNMFLNIQRLFQRTLVVISALSLFAVILTGFFDHSVFAQEREHKTNLNDVKKALKSDQALPDTIFGRGIDGKGGCKVSFSAENTGGGTNQEAQNASNREVMMGCIGSVIRFLFVISVVVMIVKIAAAQLGVVAFGGDDSGKGPVYLTRKYLQEGLVGIAMVGGAMLILELFNTNFGSALDKLFGK